ncbi:MAG TPA: hypothetical protein VEI02_04735, partial [Planctomycetota bacterium]|nr:hypothetical protein [Planctomycetota bacterium]
LWLEGEDLFAARGAALRAVEARLAVDPYATLDVVLAPRRPFPFDLLDALKRLFDAATPSYQSRSLALRGENAQRRLAVVLRPDVRVPRDWGLAVSDLATVWRDQSFAAALAAAEAHGDGRPGARILDGPPPSDARAWRDLFERCDPDAVAFADRSFEERWIAALLGHRPPTLAPL